MCDLEIKQINKQTTAKTKQNKKKNQNLPTKEECKETYLF